MRQLAAFQKIHLEPGEAQTVFFSIPVQTLGYYTPDMQYTVAPGTYTIYAGGNSRDCLETQVAL